MNTPPPYGHFHSLLDTPGARPGVGIAMDWDRLIGSIYPDPSPDEKTEIARKRDS